MAPARITRFTAGAARACAMLPTFGAVGLGGLLAIGVLGIAARGVLADGDTTPPVGTLTLPAAGTGTAIPTITVDTPATDDLSGVATVELSNDGTHWRAWAYPGPGAWDVTDADYGGTSAQGTKVVHARWTDGVGNVSQPVSKSIVYDTTPPKGALTIGDGSGSTRDPSVVLHVVAADNVKVTTVEVHGGGPNAIPQTFAYSPTLTWSLGSPIADGAYNVTVTWSDGAGNESSDTAQVWVDRTAPDLTAMWIVGNSDTTRTIRFTASDVPGITAARFSVDGSTWGKDSPIAPATVETEYRVFDPAYGGSPVLGKRTIWAEVRDAAGNWSTKISTVLTVTVPVSIAVSASPTTGKPITLSPHWPAAVTVPADAVCRWEFIWGDDRSVLLGERDETYGYVMVEGRASAGYCDHWTFTLPWTPVRRYLVAFQARTLDWTELARTEAGGTTGGSAFASTVGSTSRSITSSNLPMFYVLPDAYVLTVGERAVYHAYAIGGAVIRSTDTWEIQYENVPERHPGSPELVFYPDRTGHITVCLGRTSTYGSLGACFDPPVKAGSSGGSGGTGGAGGSGAAAGSPLPADGTAAPSDGPPTSASPIPSPVASGDSPSSFDPTSGTSTGGATARSSDVPDRLKSPAGDSGTAPGIALILVIVLGALGTATPPGRRRILALRSRLR